MSSWWSLFCIPAEKIPWSLANDFPIIRRKNWLQLTKDTFEKSVEIRGTKENIPQLLFLYFHFFLFVPSSLFFWQNLVGLAFSHLWKPARHCTGGRAFWMSSYITGSEPSNFRQRWTFMGFSSSSDSARTWRAAPWTQTEPNGPVETVTETGLGFEVVWKGRPSWRVVWHTVMMIASEWLKEPCVFLL